MAAWWCTPRGSRRWRPCRRGAALEVSHKGAVRKVLFGWSPKTGTANIPLVCSDMAMCSRMVQTLIDGCRFPGNGSRGIVGVISAIIQANRVAFATPADNNAQESIENEWDFLAPLTEATGRAKK